MEKLQTKNIDMLLQRRSLEFILDDTLRGLTESIRKIECSFKLLRDFQSQCQNEEKHFSNKQNKVSNLMQKLEEDKKNATIDTGVTLSAGAGAGLALLSLTSGPAGLIAAGYGLVTTLASASRVKEQGDMLIAEDNNLLREATTDLKDSRKKIKEIKQNILQEEKLQDRNITAAEVYSYHLIFVCINLTFNFQYAQITMGQTESLEINTVEVI